MGLFDNFPYTNFHELNLDWLIKRVKALEDAFPAGVVGIIKGGTGASTAQGARENLEIRGDTIPLNISSPGVTVNDQISAALTYYTDLASTLKYKMFYSVSSLSLSPGAASITDVWGALLLHEILIAPVTEFAASECPENKGAAVIIKNATNSGCILFSGNDSYIMGFSANLPTGTWKQLYTDSDIVPIANGGTGADNAADALHNLGIDFSGTVLSVAGVGADPSGNVPLVASDIDINYTKYKSITEIGLPVGSTIAAVWTALPTYAEIEIPSTQISDPPTGKSGFIVALKGATSGYIEFKGKTTSDGDFRQYLTLSDVPDGSWNTAGGGAAYETEDVTVTDDWSISSNATSTAESASLPSKAGYTALALANVFPENATNGGSGGTNAIPTAFRITGGKVQVRVWNHSGSTIKIKVTCKVIYLKDA